MARKSMPAMKKRSVTRVGTKRRIIKRRPAQSFSQRLLALLNDGRRLVLVRHANTDQPPPGGKDSSRKLTSKGHRQCWLARNHWFRKLGSPAFACSSAAGRCKDTVRLLLDDKGADVNVIQSVYDSPDALDDLFSDLGYAPLAKYFENFEHSENLFERNAKNILTEILNTVRGSRETAAKVVVLCGHAVYTNACALLCARELGAPSKQISSLLKVNLGEVEGFVVALRGNKVHVVHKHTRTR